MSKQSQTAHRVPPYRRPLIVASFFIILAAATLATILILNLNHPEDAPPEPISTAPVITEVDNDPVDTDLLPEPENKVTQYEGEDPNILPELTGRVAYKAIERDQTFATLTISASIDQYLQTPGTCAIRLIRPSGSDVYTASLPTQTDVTTSSCGPFEIPVQDFSPGSYQIELTVTGDGKTGLITDGVQI